MSIQTLDSNPTKMLLFIAVSIALHITAAAALTLLPKLFGGMRPDAYHDKALKRGPIPVDVVRFPHVSKPIFPEAASKKATPFKDALRSESLGKEAGEETHGSTSDMIREHGQEGELAAERSQKGLETTSAPVLFPSRERLSEIVRNDREGSAAVVGSNDSLHDGRSRVKMSLSTSDLKYRKYLLALKHKIELYWGYPSSSARRGEQGRMRIDFIVRKDGTVEVKDMAVVKSTSYPTLDDAALTAIRLGSPFKPLPDDFESDEMLIRAGFEYILIREPM